MKGRWTQSFSRYFTVIAGSICLTALYGHAYQLPVLYQWEGEGNMSIPSAIFGLTVSIALFLLSRNDQKQG
jgi:hypothetical protein